MTITALCYYLRSFFSLLKGIRNPGVLFSLAFSKGKSYAAKVILKNGMTFLVFSLMDVWVLKETILDRQYEQAGVPLQDHWTVVDIGAALGDYSVWAAKQIPHGRLIAVEPYPPSISLLRSNLEKNHILNAEIFQGAVAASDGIADLRVAGKAVQNSTSTKEISGNMVKVKTISLESLFQLFSIQKCDYLKMDCEGGEYEILFSVSKEMVSRLDRICMEIHDGITEHSRQEMIQFLENNGYSTRLTHNPVHHELAYLYAEKSNLQKDRP